MMPWLHYYAGLLLRGLLDHFGGDATKPLAPLNAASESEYRVCRRPSDVAEYARRVLEHATTLDDPQTNTKSFVNVQSAASSGRKAQPATPPAARQPLLPSKNNPGAAPTTKSIKRASL